MAATPQSQGPAARRRWLGWVKLAVTVAVLAVIFHFVPIGSIWDGIQRTEPLTWLLVLGAFIAGHVIAALKWRLLVGHDIPIVTVVRAHFAGLAANLAMPGVAGGDIARAALLTRHAQSVPTLVTGSVLDRLVDVGVLVILAAIGATLLGSTGDTGNWLRWIAVGLLGLGAIAYAALPFLSQKVEARLQPHAKRKLARLAIDLAGYMARHRTRLLVCVVLSLLIQGAFVGLNIVLSRSMLGPVDVAMWLFAWPLAKLIATLPISIGGLGVREASLASVFTAFGSPSPIVISVGFIWQTILISAGLIGLAVQLVSRRTPSDSVGQEDA